MAESARGEVNPKAIRPSTGTTGVLSMVRASFEGPMPPPDMLERYNAVMPGLAERIVRMAEDRHAAMHRQSEHRQSLENRVIDNNIAAERCGQWMGLGIAVTALCTSLVMTLCGHDWVGGIVGGATLVSLVSVFVIGKAKNAKALREKRDN